MIRQTFQRAVAMDTDELREKERKASDLFAKIDDVLCEIDLSLKVKKTKTNGSHDRHIDRRK